MRISETRGEDTEYRRSPDGVLAVALALRSEKAPELLKARKEVTMMR